MKASIPVWVIGVFALILFVGHRQSKDRVVRPFRVAVIALAMLVLSLSGVTAAFGLEPAPLAGWLSGIVAALALGAFKRAPRPLERHADGILVPGSWTPLRLMLGIFSVKFVLGFANATSAWFVRELWFAVVASSLLGLISGAFTARALAVQRCYSHGR